MLSLKGKVRVESQGRAGDIVVGLSGAEVHFWWEYGGGACLAMVQVPDSQRWGNQELLRSYPRLEFLEAMAAEISALKCPGATHTISESFIAFYG